MPKSLLGAWEQLCLMTGSTPVGALLVSEVLQEVLILSKTHFEAPISPSIFGIIVYTKYLLHSTSSVKCNWHNFFGVK